MRASSAQPDDALADNCFAKPLGLIQKCQVVNDAQRQPNASTTGKRVSLWIGVRGGRARTAAKWLGPAHLIPSIGAAEAGSNSGKRPLA